MRTTVYIPDELADRLEKWKDRINVSSLLQEALSREVGRLEALPTSVDDLDSVVDRLRTEKEAWEKKWREVGIRFGTEWAKHAPYSSLRRYAEGWRRESKRKNPDLPISDAADLALWEIALEGGHEPDAEFVMQSGILSKYPALGEIYQYDDEYLTAYRCDYDARALTVGWADSVLAFWDMIREVL